MNFVSENEIEEAKKKRAEEWEKARSQGRELPQVEEESFRDTRSLYERLKEQKDKKQDEFEEQLKFKNMIYKGLNTEDASFLEMVAKKNTALEDESLKKSLQKPSKSKLSDDFKTKQKSQRELLGSVIIRKRKTEDDNLTVKKCHIENKRTYIEDKSTDIKDKITYIRGKNTDIEDKNSDIKDTSTYTKDKSTDIEDKSTDIENKSKDIEVKSEKNKTDFVKGFNYAEPIKPFSILGTYYSSSEED